MAQHQKVAKNQQYTFEVCGQVETWNPAIDLPLLNSLYVCH